MTGSFLSVSFLGTLLLFSPVSIFAQDKETTLTNGDVVQMVKGGLSEGIIVAKIQSARTDFDTSAAQLVTLKEAGISDDVVLAMLESKGRGNVPAGQVIRGGESLDLKTATGRKKVLVESVDEKSQVEITKVLQKEGFQIVSDKSHAELVLRLTFSTSTLNVGYSPGLFGGITMGNSSEIKRGKLVVYLLKDSREHLVWVKEFRRSFPGKLLEKQAKDFSEDFVKDFKKASKS